MAHGDTQLAADCCFVLSDVGSREALQYLQGQARKKARVVNEALSDEAGSLVPLQFQVALHQGGPREKFLFTNSDSATSYNVLSHTRGNPGMLSPDNDS